MDLCTEIANAKCCIANMASEYVKAVTFGVSTPDMYNSLVLFNGYIDALERYEKVNCENKERLIKNKSLHLQCLTQENICFMLNQISLQCDNTVCGC